MNHIIMLKLWNINLLEKNFLQDTSFLEKNFIKSMGGCYIPSDMWDNFREFLKTLVGVHPTYTPQLENAGIMNDHFNNNDNSLLKIKLSTMEICVKIISFNIFHRKLALVIQLYNRKLHQAVD